MSIHTLKMKRLISLFLLFSLLCPDISKAVIGFDAAASNFTAPPGASITWSHTVTTSGGSVVLVVGVNATGTTTTGVTYNGDAMTSLSTQAYNGATDEVSLWYLISPDTGANNVIVTLAGASAGAQAGSISLTGVDQTDPLDANNCTSGSSANPSVSVTTVGDNSWLADIVGETSGSTTLTVGGSQTQRWSRAEITSSGGGSTRGPISPPAATTMTWTIGASGPWAHCAVSLAEAAQVTKDDPTLLLLTGSN